MGKIVRDLLYGQKRNSYPKASSYGSTTVMIPDSTATERWYVIAIADGKGVVSETSETNNIYVRSIRIK
jgi:hypothetical protein